MFEIKNSTHFFYYQVNQNPMVNEHETNIQVNVQLEINIQVHLQNFQVEGRESDILNTV